MEIYLIRHTRVNLKEGICYGQSDVELAESFKDELKFLQKKLEITPQMVFYSSPLKRCVILSKKLSSKPPNIDKRLNELDFGDWELKEWDSIRKEKLKIWSGDFVNNRPPNGESYIELYYRTIEFFKDLLTKDHKKVVIITHSGVIRSILSYLEQIPLKDSFSFQINYGSIKKITINKKSFSSNMKQ